MRASKYRMGNGKRRIFSDLDISYDGFIPVRYEKVQDRRKKVLPREEEPKKEILLIPSPEIPARPVSGWNYKKAEARYGLQHDDGDYYRPSETTISYTDRALVNRKDPTRVKPANKTTVLHLQTGNLNDFETYYIQ